MSMSFGDELKRERELRSISLREVAEATKVNLRYLEAIERNDFEHLPGGVFNRGFVRAYAEFIGIDPEATVNAYLLEERTQKNGRDGEELPLSNAVMRGTVATVRRRGPEPVEAPAPAPLRVRPSAPLRDRAVLRWTLLGLALAGVLAVTGWLLFDALRAHPGSGVRKLPAPVGRAHE